MSSHKGDSMLKKKYTDEDARQDFKALRDSCVEGKEEAWDCSTEEGKEGFDAMIELIDRLMKHYGAV